MPATAEEIPVDQNIDAGIEPVAEPDAPEGEI